jgi:hypothetical protein
MTIRRGIVSLFALSALLPVTAQACATCGCSLSSDAATGYTSEPGWRLDLLFNYIDQSQLRSGGSAISAPQVALINNNGGTQEVEHDTVNRYLTLGLTYSQSEEWNFNLQVPWVDRSHSTYANATTDQLTPANLSGAAFGDFGDIRVIANYQGLLENNHLGVQFGVKLPTGRYGGQNVVTGATVGRDPVFFSSGPNAAAGQTIDTSLQPGTGSTDVIAGAYYYQAVSQDFDAFINGRFEVSTLQMLDGVNANYRPGNTTTVSFGLRYENTPEWVPQVQVNISHKSADQGALADTTDTAGTVAYLSPGVTVRLGAGILAYGFLQVPVYSALSGYQLFPRWTASAGVSYAF